ncbi:wiskott-Aldrich syndrome protein family member 1-like [Bombyx mandarina]|uniref:Wiskott-Aldrich syndrome protein family member 1-like n=1 Tax=Bombyx mandarina TaxID=7092 RepID=A0A6J2J8G5_BOMMA|nr:wiskott-Aldrich syndrome protein family member 1-like [Bombyx mandarina]
MSDHISQKCKNIPIANLPTKICNVEPVPEPPPPNPCTLQRIKQKEKAGIKICPRIPVEQPPPPAPCVAICIEKIKNPPVPPSANEPIVCVVQPEKTTTERCDAILDAVAAHPDLPWPGCAPNPLPPPPPKYDPCEEQLRKQKIEECKKRTQRYLE